MKMKVDCPACGGSGFDTPGTGYDNVCSECGGQKEVAAMDDKLTRKIGTIRAIHGSECIQSVYLDLVEVAPAEQAGWIGGDGPFGGTCTWYSDIYRTYLGECTDTSDGVLFRKVEP